MVPPPRFNVLGTGVHATDYGDTVAAILAAARAGSPLAVSALATHALTEASSDPAYAACLDRLDFAVPDGQPVRWALNWLHGAGLRDRVYGPFLMRAVCAAAARDALPVYLFGSTEQTVGRLADNLRRAHPGLQVAGRRASRFRPITAAEAREDAAEILATGSRIVFCGLGCPRQEWWVHAMRPLLPRPLIAVGAAFPLWAGERRMAPAWMQRAGLEWAFRLAQEPGRLTGRYLRHNPRFLAGILLQRLGPRRPDPPRGQVEPRYFG